MKRIFLFRALLNVVILSFTLGIGSLSKAQENGNHGTTNGLACFKALISLEQVADRSAGFNQASAICQADFSPQDLSFFKTSLVAGCQQNFPANSVSPGTGNNLTECEIQALEFMNALHPISQVLRSEVPVNMLNQKIDDLFGAADTVYGNPNEVAMFDRFQSRCVENFSQNADVNLLNFCKLQAVTFVESLRRE